MARRAQLLLRTATAARPAAGSGGFPRRRRSLRRRVVDGGCRAARSLYNPACQLTETTALGTLTARYDLAGNLTRLDWPAAAGGYIQYTYDLLNRMDQVRENGATSGAGLLADYSYDAFGRPTSLTRGNGAATSWGYVANTRNWSMTQNLSGTANDLTQGCTFSPAPQVTERAISNTAYSFKPPTPSEAYARDVVNRSAAVAGQAFTYDGRQNLTDDGPNTFAYDIENRLPAVSGASAITLAYDPLGRLKQTVSGATTTRFLYDSNRIVFAIRHANGRAKTPIAA